MILQGLYDKPHDAQRANRHPERISADISGLRHPSARFTHHGYNIGDLIHDEIDHPVVKHTPQSHGQIVNGEDNRLGVSFIHEIFIDR